MNPFRVDGKLALITGGASGIGYGAAKALAESGANLVLAGRRIAELERSAEMLKQLGAAVHVSPVDLKETSAISKWFDDVCSQTGVPDILVNAAGMTRRGPAVDLSLDDWSAVMTVNAEAIFELSRCFARRRISDRLGGNIVNVASLMTFAARPGTSVYAASKGAVGQLTKAMAVEWAKHGITVNAIAPGYIDTELTQPLVGDPEFSSWVVGRCPLGRWGTPEDIAWPIVFLSSAASAFLTGQVIPVDGGWLATF